MDPTTWAANSALERLQTILERRKAPGPLDKNAIGPLAAESLVENKPPPPKRTAPEPKPEPLSAEALAAATARYSTTADLRKLLTYDAERGGTPIKLLSARWMLTHFQKEGNESARLEHRQWLEREHPEAFVSGEALERVLAELEERTVKYEDRRGREQEKHGSFYMSKATSGESSRSRRTSRREPSSCARRVANSASLAANPSSRADT